MFASALARPGTSTSASSHAYRQVALETGAATATPHQLVLMLFEGFRDSIAQARGAIAAGRIEARGRAIGRAIGIVSEGLCGGLNLEAGGALALDLQALYGYVAKRLSDANLHSDIAALEECQRLIDPVHQAWLAIGARAGSNAA